MSTFCEHLRNARKSAGLSQEEIAEKLDIGYSTYRRCEQGGTEPTISDAARIADLLQVSLDYLAGRTDHPSALQNRQEK